MIGWERTTWSAVADLRYGKALRDYRQSSDGVVVFGTNGPVGYTHTAQVKGPGVIIGRKGAYRGVHYSAADFWVIDTAFYLSPKRPLDSRWAYYSLRLADINGLDSGSAIPSTTRESFGSLPALIPGLSEQRAIAAVLGALDDKIASNDSLSDSVDEYLAARFEESTRSSVKSIELSDVADVNRTTLRPRSDRMLRYIDIAAVGVGRLDFPERTHWSDAPGRARRGMERGDTIWSTVRPNRRSHALNLSSDPELVASTGLAVLSPRSVGFAYLYEATRRPEFVAYLENVAEGSAYPAVRAERFLHAPVPALDPEGVSKFEQLAAPLREASFAASEQNRTLAATRDALLPQLMSGKLRVRDAEKLASGAGA